MGLKLRVGIVTETWLPSTNGVVTRLRATFKELERAGHEILVIAPGAAGDETGGMRVHRSPTMRIPFVYGGEPWGVPGRGVGRALEGFAPDVVHVVNPVMLGIAGVVACRRRGYPLVLSYHTNVDVYAGYYHLGWLRSTLHRLSHLLYSQADVTLATSREGQAALSKIGIDDTRLWRRGVDLELFNPARAPQVPKAGRPLVAVYVGRLAQEKGVDRLEPLVRGGKGIHLLLVGEGPDHARLKRRFAGTPTTFAGCLYGQDLARAYAAADAFVFPSTTETVGLVLLEAMATGLPIVAADSPATRETLASYPAARLFDPGGGSGRPGHGHREPAPPAGLASLLTDLVTSPACPSRQEARTSIQDCNWELATKELEAHYQDAMLVASARSAGRALPRSGRARSGRSGASGRGDG
ncbi:MAG: glycosyltransferase [Acidimicrobiales bacterium]